MIYPRRDNLRAQRKRRTAIGILICCIIFIFIANYFFPHFLSPISHSIAVPMLEAKSTAADSGSGVWGILHSKLSLIQENRNLREQLALLKATQLERDSYKIENESLQTLMGRATSTSVGVLAYVLSKPNFSPYDTILVDVGSADHIKVGDNVLVDESVIVGQVESVSAYSANILLFSAPEEKNQVLIGTKALETTAVGKGGGVFEVRLPKNAGVEEGNTITLAKSPHLILGSITRIDTTSTDSFERVLFTSPVNLQEIHYVTIHSPEIHETSPNHH